MSDVVLRCEGLTKRFGLNGTGTFALRNVYLSVSEGEIVALVGPSGSGKTTLLSIAGGLLGASAGRIWLAGTEISTLEPTRRRAATRGLVGFVFQRSILLPELTALENVTVGLHLSGLAWKDASKRAATLLERLGLGHRLHCRPEVLSTGEQQRAAIARALGFSPRLLLADEPTASLDWRSGRGALSAMVELAREHSTAVVIATHDERVLPFATRLARLDDAVLVEDRALGDSS